LADIVASALPGDKMFLSISVPESLLPNQSATPPDADTDGDVKMVTTQEQEQERKLRGMMVPAICAVEGCPAKRKYSTIGWFEIGSTGHAV
jgi:hypothetical protein